LTSVYDDAGQCASINLAKPDLRERQSGHGVGDHTSKVQARD
jgi:hypothetical protein